MEGLAWLNWLGQTGLMSKRCPHWHCAPVRLVLVFDAHLRSEVRGLHAKNTRLHTKTCTRWREGGWAALPVCVYILCSP